uniref:Uncharacterized protein n=1 Tax=Rhizophora mucronata TaxID=61149 RepID=A0A2P2PTB7_RHIMU
MRWKWRGILMIFLQHMRSISIQLWRNLFLVNDLNHFATHYLCCLTSYCVSEIMRIGYMKASTSCKQEP